ncbi:mucoidy inhibitor MuiA family protein [Limibacillus halophilus]
MLNRAQGLTSASRFALLAAFPISLACLPPAEADASERLSPEESAVEAVTVYPQGARVTRKLSLTLEPGVSEFELTGLTAEIDPASLRVEGAPSWVSIASVESSLRYLEDAREEEARVLQARIEALGDQRRALEHQRQVAAKQLQLLDSVIVQAARPATKGEGELAPPDPAHLRNLLALIGEESARALAQQREAEQGLREVEKALQRAQAELNQLSGRQEETLSVTLALESRGSGEAELQLVYQVSSASWRPLYDLRLDSEASELTLVQLAEVTQSSGEAWEQAAITLSTSQPGRNAALPDPQTWFLDAHYRRKALSEAPRASDELYLKDEKNALLGQGQAAAEPEEEREVQLIASEFAAEFVVPGRVTLPADGSAHKLHLLESVSPVALAAKAFPKISRTAHLTGAFTHEGEAPLLPGVASLFRDGAFVGRLGLPLLRPGEERELDFGLDDRIAVDYRFIEGEKGFTGLINSRQRERRAFEIEVTNHHAQPIEITVFEQLPVALHEDIDVTLLDETTRPSVIDYEDRKGVIAWQGPYQPGETRKIRFAYLVSFPEDLPVAGF